MAAFQTSTASAAKGAETNSEAPASSDRTAPLAIATATTRPRPRRTDSSLPVSETAIPSRPARVNKAFGPGSQDGAPCKAIAAVRKVTPQARSTASSQVCTV